jgi:hypothetical protein
MNVERDDRIEIRLNRPVEMLDVTRASRRHYLLCTRGCGTLLNVPWSVLAAMCATCVQREDDAGGTARKEVT